MFTGMSGTPVSCASFTTPALTTTTTYWARATNGAGTSDSIAATVKVEGTEYLVMREEDIMGVVSK